MNTHPSEDVLDLVVIGGGVMGLFTAYHAAEQGLGRVAVLERGTIGDPTTASFGRTRSYRKDYLDELYVRLADDAMTLWGEFEKATGTAVLVRCGCLNIAAASVTPDLADTYAQRSTDVMAGLGVAPEVLSADEIATRYPYLRADLAHLDPSAGLVDLASVTGALTRTLAARGVAVHESVQTSALLAEGDLVRVQTDLGEFVARSVVITAGHGTNGVLAALDGCDLQVPITKDRPSEAKYFTPPAADRARWTSAQMPVIAYLDTGVYVHPIVEGVIDAVKVGYYNPRTSRATAPASATSPTSSRRSCPAWRRRRSPTSWTSISATTTWWPTTTSSWGPCRASPTSSSGSAGAAPVTSSHRGWAGRCPGS